MIQLGKPGELLLEKAKFWVKVVCETCNEEMGRRESPKGDEEDTVIPGCCRRCIKDMLANEDVPD